MRHWTMVIVVLGCGGSLMCGTVQTIPDSGVVDSGPDATASVDSGIVDSGPDATASVDSGIVDAGVDASVITNSAPIATADMFGV